MAMELTSRSFNHGREMSGKYTAEGWDISPPLEWSGAPPNAREFALICEDPDVPGPTPFVHWMLYGLSENISELPEGLPREEEIRYPVFVRQGLNSRSQIGYTGPNPPFWHGIHRYYFRLFALNASLGLAPGANRGEFFKAIENHLIEQTELLGVYEKSVAGKTRSAAGVAVAISAPVVIYAAIKRLRRSA